jgi:hypothetical protein
MLGFCGVWVGAEGGGWGWFNYGGNYFFWVGCVELMGCFFCCQGGGECVGVGENGGVFYGTRQGIHFD